MFKAIERSCGEVIYIGPPSRLIKLVYYTLRLATRVIRAVLHKNYLYGHNPLFCRLLARFWEKRISKSHYDLIFAPIASCDIAFLRTNIPIIYLADATIYLLKDYYPAYSNVLGIKNAEKIDRMAIEKASALIFSSQWAANSAKIHHKANKTKIHVIPFGANLEDIPPRDTVLQKKKNHTCRLLFLGKDWNRKGGDLALGTLRDLQKRGIASELIISGCKPQIKLDENNVKVIGRVPRVDMLFSNVDFFILPTKADCTPIVFCEANAFGIPVITSNTGGVSDVITNGQNGFTLPLEATSSDYADVITRIWADQEAYISLCRTSRKAYEERLNWQSWGKKVKKVIRNIFPKSKTYCL